MSPLFQIWDVKSSKTFLWLRRQSLWNKLLMWLFLDFFVQVPFRHWRAWDGVLVRCSCSVAERETNEARTDCICVNPSQEV